MKLLNIILAILKAIGLEGIFNFKEKNTELKIEQNDMRETEHKENTNARLVEAAREELEKKKLYIKDFVEYYNYENAVGVEVVITDEGKVVMNVEDAEKLVEFQDVRKFKKRRLERKESKKLMDSTKL